MNVGRVVVGVLLVVVGVGVFAIRLQVNKIIWSAFGELSKWGGETLDSTRKRRERKRKD